MRFLQISLASVLALLAVQDGLAFPFPKPTNVSTFSNTTSTKTLGEVVAAIKQHQALNSTTFSNSTSTKTIGEVIAAIEQHQALNRTHLQARSDMLESLSRCGHCISSDYSSRNGPKSGKGGSGHYDEPSSPMSTGRPSKKPCNCDEVRNGLIENLPAILQEIQKDIEANHKSEQSQGHGSSYGQGSSHGQDSSYGHGSSYDHDSSYGHGSSHSPDSSHGHGYIYSHGKDHGRGRYGKDYYGMDRYGYKSKRAEPEHNATVETAIVVHSSQHIEKVIQEVMQQFAKEKGLTAAKNISKCIPIPA